MVEKVEFTGALGDVLAARLDLPQREPKAFAIFAHCFTCSKDLKAVGAISEALNEQGIALLRFDFTGLGHSEGEFENTNFSSNVEDLICAGTFLKNNFQPAKMLIGHSLGGTAVLAAASQFHSVKAVATIGSPADTQHVQHNFGDHICEIQEQGESEVSLFGRTFKIKRQFLEDIESHNMEERIARIEQALLVFHSPVDRQVSIENARKIYDSARHPKSFISLDTADHLLTNKEDAKYVGYVLAAWAQRYLN